MNTEEYVYRELAAQRPDVISSLIPEISAATGEDKIIVQNTMIGLQPGSSDVSTTVTKTATWLK